jgi:hypothetical protein
MCYVAAIPYIIAAVGTAYSMYSENKAAHYQAAVATQNSKLADQQAINANAAGSYAADQARIRGNLARGSQLAAFAANNVEMSTGSAADILGDTAMFTAQDERQARTNAALQSYGFQVQSLASKGAAAYSLYQGKTSEMSSFLAGASSAAGAYNATPSSGSTVMTQQPSYSGGYMMMKQ